MVEKQRIALGPFDAGGGEIVEGVDVAAGEFACFFIAQWYEVYRRQWRVVKAGPPRRLHRVADDARGQHQDYATSPRQPRQGRKMIEQRVVGPMNVLDPYD